MQIKGYIRQKDLTTVTVATQTSAADMDPIVDFGFVIQYYFNNTFVSNNPYSGGALTGDEQVLASFTLEDDGKHYWRLCVMPTDEATAELYDTGYYLSGSTIYVYKDAAWSPIEVGELIEIADNYYIERAVWCNNTVTALFGNMVVDNRDVLTPCDCGCETPKAYDPYTLIEASQAAARMNAYSRAQEYIDKATLLITNINA